MGDHYLIIWILSTAFLIVYTIILLCAPALENDTPFFKLKIANQDLIKKNDIARKDDVNIPTEMESHSRPRSRFNTSLTTHQHVKTASTTKVQSSNNPLKWKWLWRMNVLIFYLSIMMVGLTFSVISNFAWVYLKTELNAPSQLFGVSGPFQVACELPFFFFGDKARFAQVRQTSRHRANFFADFAISL